MSITLAEDDKTRNDIEEAEDGEDSTGSIGNEDSDNSSEEEEDDEDPETIARRLGDQLWADIQRARAGAAPAVAPPVISPKEAAVMTTMRAVLTYANSDALVRSELSKSIIPGTDGSNVIDMLNKIVSDGKVPRLLVGPLSQVLVKLAKSETLFSPLPAVLSQVALKRKRSDMDEEDSGSVKRTAGDETASQVDATADAEHSPDGTE